MYARSFRSWLTPILVALPVLAAAPPGDSPERFASPDAAIDTLVAAVRAGNVAQLRLLFGEAGLRDVSAGDPVANEAQRQKFVAAYDAKHAIDVKGDAATLSIGADDWPFAIPLKHASQGWTFDVAAGREEILDRRIGANELYTQQVMLAYVDAQIEYMQDLHDGNKLHVYAARLLSSPGKHDGLYWPTEVDQSPSPLGPLIAEARAAGYHPGENAEQQPFHGYYFGMLKGQGPHAPGGAYDYVVNGKMLGGFGLVAWPAHWGSTGVKTFVVNQDGEIYEKDLGPTTPAIAKGMTRFDPDTTWQKVGAPAPIAGEADDDPGGG
ncbi:MAG: DUF2950 domain-containing protein [Rhodopila sp.]|jgi:hypothetical protein